MKTRLLFLALLPAILAVSAAAQPKKGRIALPQAMLGVWGDDAEACKGDPIEAENRVEIEKDGVSLYVTYYLVRTWRRQGDVYSGRASRGEEGEGKPAPGLYDVSLRLRPDGKLEFRADGDKPRIFVKCPPGTVVR